MPLNLIFYVNALGGGRFRIDLKSPLGDVSAEATTPFTPAELSDYQAIFTRQKPGLTRAEEAAAARSIGTRLFDFLIRKHDQINAAYFASLSQAGSDGLRIRLALDQAGELADLPWEYLRDPNRDVLALSRATPVVRYSAQLGARPALEVKPPLRVLVMLSAPNGYPPLDVEGEWARLQAATSEMQNKGLLVLERMEAATLIALQRKLRQREYHVFHFIGHSVFDELAGQGLLVFQTEDASGRAQLVSAGSLSREIGEEGTLRLVVLNSCESAQRAQQDVFAGIASALVARSVPAVVAMQYEITDAAAAAFAEEFYRALADGLPVDSAVSEGRRAIANRVQNIEWATPVIYLRSEDGVLFRTPRTPETRPLARVRATVSEGDPAPPPPNRLPWIAAAAALIVLGALIGTLLPGLLNPAVPTATFSPDATNTPLPPGALPDLSVTTIRSAPASPAPGQVFLVSIGIANNGQAPSGDFEYAWDASVRQRNAVVGTINSLPQGASRNFTLRFAYGWWGTYESVVRVDDLNAVDEVDDRNNNSRDHTIEVRPDAPFVIDFSLLPTLDFSEDGMLVESDSFIPWNLIFELAAEGREDCLTTPLIFIDREDDMAIGALEDAESAPGCALLPLSIKLRRPVGNASAEIIPQASGDATIILYADEAGTRELFRFIRPVTAGVPVTLGESLGAGANIRRVDVIAPGGPVTLTRLTLLPPT